MKSLPRELVILVTIISMGWSQSEEVVIGQEGHQVILPRAEKAIDVSWRFGKNKDGISQAVIIMQRGSLTYGQDMKGRVSLAIGNASLIISSLKSEDFGYYSCEMGRVKTLHRLYRAKVTFSPAPLVVAYQGLSLLCEVESLDQGLAFQWKSPQKTVRGKEKHLKIKQVTKKDHGEWICVITLGGQKSDVKPPNEFFIKSSITVVDLITSVPLYTTNGSSLLIPCYIFGDLELSRVQPSEGSWTFTPRSGNRGPQKVASLTKTDKYQWEILNNDKHWILNTEPLKNSLSLEIASVKQTDVGTYRCELTLNSRIISEEVEVNMLTVHSSSTSIYVGEAFNISCALVDTERSSNLTIKWKVPEKSTMNGILTEPHPAVLHSPQATEKDRGKWTCQLMRDKVLLVSADLNLKVESRPVNVILWLGLCGAGVLFIFIILIILKLRPRVHCRRRPKKKYCRCKNPQLKGFYKT